jgi:hypothetical protein
MSMDRVLLTIGMLSLVAAIVVAQKQTEPQPALGALAKTVQEDKARTSKADTKTDQATPATTPTATTPAKPATKKYTNSDLGAGGSGGSSYVPLPSTSTVASSSGGSAKKEEKGEAYWRARATPLLEKIHLLSARLSEAKARLDTLPPDRDGIPQDPYRRTMPTARQRLSAAIQDGERELAGYQKALDALEEQGRRAGAQPGWFR